MTMVPAVQFGGASAARPGGCAFRSDGERAGRESNEEAERRGLDSG